MASAAFAAAKADRAAEIAACITDDWPERMPDAIPEDMAMPMLLALLAAVAVCAFRAADSAVMRLDDAVALSPAKLYCVMPWPTPADTSFPRGTMRWAGDWLCREPRYAPSRLLAAVAVSPLKSYCPSPWPTPALASVPTCGITPAMAV